MADWGRVGATPQQHSPQSQARGDSVLVPVSLQEKEHHSSLSPLSDSNGINDSEITLPDCKSILYNDTLQVQN